MRSSLADEFAQINLESYIVKLFRELSGRRVQVNESHLVLSSSCSEALNCEIALSVPGERLYFCNTDILPVSNERRKHAHWQQKMDDPK